MLPKIIQLSTNVGRSFRYQTSEIRALHWKASKILLIVTALVSACVSHVANNLQPPFAMAAFMN